MTLCARPETQERKWVGDGGPKRPMGSTSTISLPAATAAICAVQYGATGYKAKLKLLSEGGTERLVLRPLMSTANDLVGHQCALANR